MHEGDSRLYNNLYVYGVHCTSRVLQLYEPCFIRDQRPVSHSKSSWVNASGCAAARVTLPTVCHGHATALVSQAQAVSFRTPSQPAELELTIWHPSLAGYAWPGLPTAKPARHGARWPAVAFCGLQVCCISLRPPQPCMQQVKLGLAHCPSRVQAKRP